MSPFAEDEFAMKNSEDKKELFSELEKEIAISILKGMSISKCSKQFEVGKLRCQTILNIFCMKSNHILYIKLQQSRFVWPAIYKIRHHSETFIEDSKKPTNVTIDSSIWTLDDVPIMTLNAIWKKKSYSIRELLKYSQRDLLRFPCLGKVGLKRLILSLDRYGFSIKE